MVIPINDHETTRSGMIDQWQAAFVARRLREAKQDAFDLVILEIDTNGGDLAACEKINKTIQECGVPVIAFVRNKAFSGGAIIALGCQAIVMEPGSQIGGAQAVSALGTNFESDMREKARSMLVAMVRGLCERNGYPEPLARGMVDQGIEIHETDDPQHRFMTSDEIEDWTAHEAKRGPAPTSVKTWKKTDTILTLTASEAFDGNLASGLYAGRDALLKVLTAGTPSVYENNITATEKIARFLGHPLISVLLVVVGLIALVWELKSPGHGIGFGVFGMCIGVFFWLMIFVDSAGTAELILFGLGAALLAAELFLLAGFGVAGFAGITLIIASIMLSFIPEGALANAFKSPGESNPFQAQLLADSLKWALAALFAFILAVILGLVGGIKLPGLSRMALHTSVSAGTASSSEQSITAAYPNTNQTSPTPAQMQPPETEALVGKEGIAETVLRPSGKVRLDGVTYDATAEGAWISPGAKVKVLEVQSTGLLVRTI